MNNKNDGPNINPWCGLLLTIEFGLCCGVVANDLVEFMDPCFYALLITFIITKIIYNRDKRAWEAERERRWQEEQKKRIKEWDEWNHKWLGPEVAAKFREGYKERGFEFDD